MATNQYFNHYSHTPAHDIIEEGVVETIQMSGFDILYIPREDIDLDYLFSEDNMASYSAGTEIEVYLKDFRGWDGQGDLFSKFGLDIRDSVSLSLSKARFSEELPQFTRPREGDLVFFPMSKTLLEIKFVEHEDPFFQAGKVYVYDLKCEAFTYNREEFNTGNQEIDGMINDLGLELDVLNAEGLDNNELEAEYDSISTFDPNDPF